MSSRNRSYYLTDEVINYIEQQAQAANRSPSNWLNNLVFNMIQESDDHETRNSH